MTPDPKHPITDVDARFSTVHRSETHAVIEALRKAGVYFECHRERTEGRSRFSELRHLLVSERRRYGENRSHSQSDVHQVRKKPNQRVEATADSAFCFDLEPLAGGASRWRSTYQHLRHEEIL